MPLTLELDITLIGGLISVFIGAITLVTLIRRSLAAGTRDNAQAIAALRDTCESLSRRMQIIEKDVSFLPSAEKFNELSTSVAQMTTNLQGVSKTVDATQQSIRRVENFLIKKGMS